MISNHSLQVLNYLLRGHEIILRQRTGLNDVDKFIPIRMLIPKF